MYNSKTNRPERIPPSKTYCVILISLFVFSGIISCDITGSSTDSGNSNDEDEEVDPTETVLSNKIVFASDRDGDTEIFLMDADGSNQQKMTDNSAADFAPSISNDGTQIAFVSDRGGAANLYIMDADGSNIQQLIHSAANTVYSGWSSDDSQIIFDDQRDGSLNIYTVNTDGSNLRH